MNNVSWKRESGLFWKNELVVGDGSYVGKGMEASSQVCYVKESTSVEEALGKALSEID